MKDEFHQNASNFLLLRTQPNSQLLSPLKKHHYRHNYHVRMSKIEIYPVEAQSKDWIGGKGSGPLSEVLFTLLFPISKQGIVGKYWC